LAARAVRDRVPSASIGTALLNRALRTASVAAARAGHLRRARLGFRAVLRSHAGRPASGQTQNRNRGDQRSTHCLPQDDHPDVAPVGSDRHATADAAQHGTLTTGIVIEKTLATAAVAVDDGRLAGKAPGPIAGPILGAVLSPCRIDALDVDSVAPGGIDRRSSADGATGEQ